MKFAFTHIPRTGGTSIRAFMKKRVTKYLELDALSQLALTTDREISDQSFFATHCGFSALRRVSSDALKFTVLRNPVDRIASQYYYLRETKDEFLASSHARDLSLIDFVYCDEPSVSAFVDNTITHHMCSDKNPTNRKMNLKDGELAALRTAKKNLEVLDFVGFFDRLQDVYAWLGADDPVKDQSRLRPSGKPEISAHDRSKIEERVKLDLELFSWAVGTCKG